MNEFQDIIKKASDKQLTMLCLSVIREIVSRTCRYIDRFTKRCVWFVFTLVILTSATISYYFIYQARAERDSLQEANYHYKMRLDSIEAAYGRK